MSTSANPATSRPGSVTLVVVLIWISAILSILGGVILFFWAADGGAQAIDANQAWVTGGVEIVIGLILALLASALGHGSRFARFLITVAMLLRLIISAVGLVEAWGQPYSWLEAVSVAFALLILWLLWNAKAGAFFARS